MSFENAEERRRRRAGADLLVDELAGALGPEDLRVSVC